jgi:hypothetical protein
METNLVPETEFLLPDEAARLMRKPNKKVLAVERCLRRDHPPYFKIGRKILYRRADVLAWLEAHVVNPTTSKNDVTLGSFAKHDHPAPAGEVRQ